MEPFGPASVRVAIFCAHRHAHGAHLLELRQLVRHLLGSNKQRHSEGMAVAKALDGNGNSARQTIKSLRHVRVLDWSARACYGALAVCTRTAGLRAGGESV
eukprot:1184150-Prorocentrum_minimum.AAC.2